MNTTPTAENVLRYVGFDDFKLLLWDSGETTEGHALGRTKIFLKFWHNDAEIFSSPAFGWITVGAGVAIDSDRAVRDAIDWISLKPGDTDLEHFENYTEAQIEWVQAHSDELYFWGHAILEGMADDEDFVPYEFQELEWEEAA